MRVVVPNEAHFLVVNGLAYSSHLTYESFWSLYLNTFDSVLILARSIEVGHVPPGYQLVTKNGVKLAALPWYHGPYQFLKRWSCIRKIIRKTCHPGDAFILLLPGNIGTQVLKHLPTGYPYGVEVKGDPWLSLASGSVQIFGRPFFRLLGTYNLKSQCRRAVV